MYMARDTVLPWSWKSLVFHRSKEHLDQFNVILIVKIPKGCKLLMARTEIGNILTLAGGGGGIPHPSFQTTSNNF
jgi:hypothetical protein